MCIYIIVFKCCGFSWKKVTFYRKFYIKFIKYQCVYTQRYKMTITNNRGYRFIQIALPPKREAELEAIAARTGVKKSGLVKIALDKWIKEMIDDDNSD